MPAEVSVIVSLLTALTGILMMANFPYYSFKGIDLHGRVPFFVMILVVLVFGLVTLVAPWLIMQPAMGAGVFATRTPRPTVIRLVNLSMHGVFGVCLYVGWLLIR